MGEGGNIVLDFQVPGNPLADFLRFSTENLNRACKPVAPVLFRVQGKANSLAGNTVGKKKRVAVPIPLFALFPAGRAQVRFPERLV